MKLFDKSSENRILSYKPKKGRKSSHLEAGTSKLPTFFPSDLVISFNKLSNCFSSYMHLKQKPLLEYF